MRPPVATNSLFRRLPSAETAVLRPLLEPLDLTLGDLLCEAHDEIGFAVFPSTGVISLAASMPDDATVEVGLVGRDGMFGVPLAAGRRRSTVRAVVQGDGVAHRIPARAFERALASCPTFRDRLHVYTLTLLTQVGQTALCNASHSIEARAARWMLQLSDRLESPTFDLTQEYLADMLGVRRPAVSRAARGLLKAGMLRYSRGVVEIIDRPRLETIACRCYAVLAGRYREAVA